MCGIAGILSHIATEGYNIALKMAQALEHRGPDAAGVWSDDAAQIVLSHTRLSILDLSSQGSQPMVSHSGRYVISYNGEVYNFQQIRSSLEEEKSIQWRGHSDTEVFLEAIEIWGITKTLTQANGMFALALWDKQNRQLTLARDRMGEKPLYVGWANKSIIFASELKAFHNHPDWHGTINRQALGYLLRFGYVPAPLSIYQNVFKLPPAHSITMEYNDCLTVPSSEDFALKCECYWNLCMTAVNASKNPLQIDVSTAADQLENLLMNSVRLRMVADVPIGALLSGGIDSSLITAIMQHLSPDPIKTFTIGFAEEKFDESRYAKPVADHLGTEHTEIILSYKDALEVIPRLPEIYDEPFADASQIPTVLVSKVAKMKVSVALSGDGGDELFSGYGRYRAALQVWPYLKALSPFLRQRIGCMLSSQKITAATHVMAPKNRRQMAHRIRRLGRRIMAEDFDAYYTNLLSLSLVQVSRSSWPDTFAYLQTWDGTQAEMDIEQRMMLMDQYSYLPDDILVKTDRASMAVSLELRVPFLDPNIIEFAWKLPADLRRSGRIGKLLLHRLLYRYIPQKLVDRPKKGFEIPQNEWLRGPLRDWMLDLLAPSTITSSGYLDNAAIQMLVKEHLTGQGDHGYALWPALMFQAWLTK